MAPHEEDRIRSVLAELAARPPMSEEELRYRLEPLRDCREQAISMLLDELGTETSFHDLAAAALHELAVAADAELLLVAFRDPNRSDRAHAEIAQLLAGVAGDRLERLLETDELARLSAMSLDSFLERFRDRAGLAQVRELYRQSPPAERRSLLDAMDGATRGPAAAVRLGAALDPLFPDEPDGELRALMIRRLAERPEPWSAKALTRWIGVCHGEERRLVKEAIRRLARQGVRASTREGALSAWISGVDGTGCYNVGISFPTALGLRDVLLACISVETGLRAVSLIAAVEAEAVSEIRSTLEKSQSIPVAGLDAPSAFRHVHEARSQTLALGRPLPPGYEVAAPYLARPVALPPSRLAAEAPPAVSRTQVGTLLDLPAYGSWIFSSAEIPAAAVTQLAAEMIALEHPPASRPEPDQKRLRALAGRALAVLERTGVPSRLATMLRHQAEIHRLRSEHSLAARAFVAARDIEDAGITRSPLAARMMERSLRALSAPGARAPRPEIRESFKRRIEQWGRPRRRQVVVLHFAEALSRHTEDLNERLPPSERLTLDQIEQIALDGATLAADEFTRDSTEQVPLPGLETLQVASQSAVRRRIRSSTTRITLERRLRERVERRTDLDPKHAGRLAVSMATVSRWFANEVCLRQCRRECLMDPESDGRELFYAAVHPAGLDTIDVDPSCGASAATLAPWRHVSRRLDELIGETNAALEALSSLGFAPRGEERALHRRVGEILLRLRGARQETSQAGEDPASIYTYVEEADSLDHELGALVRRLAVGGLCRLNPRPEQFSTFDPYPEAVTAWRRFERFLVKEGLIGIDLPPLHAAVDRPEGANPLLCLLRAVVRPRSAARSRLLAEQVTDFSNHTPRSHFGSRTPLQEAARIRGESLF